MDDEGLIDGGRWRRYTAAERKARDAAVKARVDDAAKGDKTFKRRIRELRGGVVQWYDSNVALRPSFRPAVVESCSLAMAIGVPVVPAGVEGHVCPKKHGTGVVVRNGKSCHLEQCSVCITHQRHDATKHQLAYELRTVLRTEHGAVVDEEMGIGPSGRIEKRQQGGKQTGQKIIGDVYVTMPSRPHDMVFMDVGWKSVMGAGVIAGAACASQSCYDDKMAVFADMNVQDANIKYIPITMSTSGAMWQASVEALSKFGLGEAAMRRIVAVGLMTQAEAAVSIIQSLEDAVRRGAGAAAASSDGTSSSSETEVSSETGSD